jgi:hypothetical protein
MACCAMSFGVSGKYCDIVGVWIAPVTAQVMMTLLGFLAMRVSPSAAFGRVHCLEVVEHTQP